VHRSPSIAIFRTGYVTVHVTARPSTWHERPQHLAGAIAEAQNRSLSTETFRQPPKLLDHSPARIRRVLYATDFSEASGRVFAAALSIAKSLDARVTILYVLPPVVPTVPELYLDAVTLDQLDKQARRWSAQQLDRLGARAKRAGVKAAPLLRDGDAADQIVSACRSVKADLIVVGTHGRRGLPKFFLGSVAERVVAMAPCPVVTVRGQS